MSFLKEFQLLQIPLEDLILATDNFSDAKYIGGGGFRKVYKGEIHLSGVLTTVAIKRLDRSLREGTFVLWELRMLHNQYRHENLVSLIGFCDEGDETLIVYEYPSNKSLDLYLSDHPDLSWHTRLSICRGAAAGLQYLHERGEGSQQRVLHRDIMSSHMLLDYELRPDISDFGLSKLGPAEGSQQRVMDQEIKSANILLDDYLKTNISDFGLSKMGPADESQQRVLHRDIKSANILLDDNLKPKIKITDFRLSKLDPTNQEFSFIITDPVVGSPGYFDPLYEKTCVLTKESDVYSFGVVLFEILCGRPAYVQDYNDIRSNLVALARKCYEEKKLDTIIDSGIRETISTKSLERFSAIAYQCLNMDHLERPSMAKIVSEIEIAYRYQVTDKKWIPYVTSKDIRVATENFKVTFGKSQYGRMYIGELSIFGKPKAVIVRRFEHSGVALMDFLEKIYFVYNKPHPNLTSIIGYCDEEKERMIVYEYPDHGRRLDEYISRSNASNSTTLTWLQRLKICIGAAQGLNYLHRHGDYHCWYNIAHILLDDKWVARLHNYLSPAKGLIVYSEYAYYAPEYINNGIETKEADVYSLGMVLFEVLCGRLCTEKVDGQKLSGKLIKELYTKKKMDEIVDPRIREQKIISYSVDKYSAIAYRCLLDDPKQRPTVDDIIKELEEVLLTIEGELDTQFEKLSKKLRERAKAAEERAKAAEEREEAAEKREKAANEMEKKMQSEEYLTEDELARKHTL